MGKAARARREAHGSRLNMERLRGAALLGYTVELDVDPRDGWRSGEPFHLWPYVGLVTYADPDTIIVDFAPLPHEVPGPGLAP